MTREEEIYNAMGDAEWKHIDGTKDIELFDMGFKEGAEWADRHPHWISVEDELPPNNGGFSDEVLTYDYASKRYVVALFSYISNCWFGCDDSVTHWMPLPEPPAKLSSVERTVKTKHLYERNDTYDRANRDGDHLLSRQPVFRQTKPCRA